MNKQQILQQAKHSGKPVVVEFWAAWCMPCKVMAPALKKTAEQFVGSVDLLKINADENPQVLKDFGVLGIPTVIVLSKDGELARHTGILDAAQLNALFQAASSREEIIIPPSGVQRILRIGSGLAVGFFGFQWGPALPLYLIGAVLIFSGLYDRCPVFKMLFPKIKAIFARKTSDVTN